MRLVSSRLFGAEQGLSPDTVHTSDLNPRVSCFTLNDRRYAWTGRQGIHWIWPTLALVLVHAGVFLIYSAVFTYFSDAYERYSSSAQAAQSLLRNIFGSSAAPPALAPCAFLLTSDPPRPSPVSFCFTSKAGSFPLFSTTLYTRLGPPYASTLLGCITLVLGFCPAVLLVYGRRLRARSKVASALLREQQEEDEKREEVRGRMAEEEGVRKRTAGAGGEKEVV